MSGQPSYLGVVTAGWVAALKNSDSLERRLAAHALAEIGRMAPEAVAPLTQALRDSESFVRVWAAAALARVEPKHPDVIPARAATTRNRGRGAGPARIAQRQRPERVRRGDGGAREPRGQGRAARGTEVSVGPPMIRLFRTLIRGGSRPDGPASTPEKILSVPRQLDEFSIFARPPLGGPQLTPALTRAFHPMDPSGPDQLFA